ALSVRREGEQAVITVADDGIGIPEEALAHIFEPFYQGHPDEARAHAGLGLGLTLVRRLVQMHGGSVHVESAGAGKGSRFTVRLPLAGEQPRAAPKIDTRESGGLRALVVDDDEDVAQSFAMLPRMMGHAAETAGDAATALAVGA